MNILYLAPTPYFSVRGAPLVTFDTIRHLTAKGHLVDLLTFPFGEDRQLPGLKITRCGRWLPIRGVSFGASITKTILDGAIFFHVLRRLLARRLGIGPRYDCIFALDEMAFACWALSPLLPCPVIYDMDASIVEQFESSSRFRRFAGLGKFAEIRCVRVARVVISQCQSYTDRVAGIDPKKTVVTVPDLPVVTADHVDSADPAPATTGLGLQSPVFLYVGNLGEHQGVDLLIDAFVRMQRTGPCGSLLIAGGKPEEIHRMPSRHPQVHFLGTVQPEDLPGIYRAAHIVVAPRLSGTNTPMKIYDYMHSGCAIVATNLESHTQILDESCAILVDPSVDNLANGMRHAAAEPRRRIDLAQRAREIVAAHTSAEIFESRLETALAEATGGKLRGPKKVGSLK
jgi:glycosyltransferase involved in cell wall biosynthesis